MMVAAIIGAEIAFWVVLLAGLLARYLCRRRRLGGWLLVAVPLVDVVLLVLTVLDLRSGAEPEAVHGLAAVYLGFSVAFGHRMVQWADVRVAHRVAGGPPPDRMAPGGTRERLRAEWADFGRALLAVAISVVLLLGASALAGEAADTTALLSWIPRLGIVLAVWFIGWPLVETFRRVFRPQPRNGGKVRTSPAGPQRVAATTGAAGDDAGPRAEGEVTAGRRQ